MKKTIITIIILLTGIINAQKLNFVAGLDGNYYLPLGTLGERFNPTAGIAISFGKEVSKDWTWVGKLEYFKFDKLNEDKLKLNKKIAVGSNTESFNIPLNDLSMSLEIVGLSANAFYNALDFGDFKTDITFGFGVYRWYSPRETYTLYFEQTTKSFYRDTVGVNGSFNKVLDVPSISQSDWSGGFNLGLHFNYEVINNFNIYAGCEYKVILGELWQALALNLENIAGFQMVNIKAGLKYQF
ncbi:MAG TPA: hypothetical protein PL041_01650 [Melioribacteraceae bacterium]|nr:hypothetical protein [Melioribacteraceae bacterium]